ncbi:helix-turn-helix transcriptional regulator [Heliorestis convoluta]|uniref:Helix-turn-helix domain-containing protein n=1 Tax=Heliorestis convoluta TaxID=356322 RepID=A0A5Q2N0I8_9FIRM|nr:helix-turn-helix domain-containing protein [Heliorestis convoluta]QGG48508.1 helix-turn-helix domain-containing protein [Heliorestis convoluta]
MFEDAQKISAVFADRTRFSIYQFIVNLSTQTCNVKEIAKEFSIHPNVARLHLSKLEEIGLLESDWDHQATPGRPGRVYKLCTKALSLTFPPRRYELLSHLLLESLYSYDDASDVLERIGYQYGKKLAQKVTAQESFLMSQSMDEETKKKYLIQILSAQGVSFMITKEGTQKVIRLTNCPFRELALEHSHLTCKLHQAIIAGLYESFFEPVQMTTLSRQSNNDTYCELLLSQEKP